MLEKIYKTTNDTLLLPVEDINFLEQGYPIWIKNELHHLVSLEEKDKDDNTRWKYMLQEPYRILLPPYEPVILVENTREQFFPLLTYVFDHPSNEAALIVLPKETEGIRGSW